MTNQESKFSTRNRIEINDDQIYVIIVMHTYMLKEL